MPTGRVVLLVLSTLVGLSTPALGQPSGGQGNRFRDPATLVQNAGVQKELKLTDEQRKKVANIPLAIRQAMREEHDNLKNLPPGEREAKRKELMKKAMEGGTRALAEVLTPDQMKRLKQIALQQGDVYALSEPDVDKVLRLSAEQKQKIKAITEEGNRQLRKLLEDGEGAGGNLDVIREKSAGLRKETLARATALLSEGQKKSWNELVGEPFDFKVERPGKALVPLTGAQPGPVGAGAARADLSWVEKRVAELQPTKVERAFDQIGWVKGLREALRLGKEHQRPVFVLTHNGQMTVGRC